MAHILDFKKICRACLSDAGPLKDLFTACSAGVFKYCTSVEVSTYCALLEAYFILESAIKLICNILSKINSLIILTSCHVIL